MFKRLDVVHIFMILIIIFLLVLLGQVNFNKNSYEELNEELELKTEEQGKTIEKLKVVTEEINLESIDHEIYELSTSFIKDVNEGRHNKYFSKELQESMFSGEVEEHHGHAKITTDIMNVTVLRESNEKYIVYGIYSNEFDTRHDVTNENAPKMMDYYSISITWEIQEEEFVVTDFQVNFLKDSISDILNTLGNMNEGANNE